MSTESSAAGEPGSKTDSTPDPSGDSGADPGADSSTDSGPGSSTDSGAELHPQAAKVAGAAAEAGVTISPVEYPTGVRTAAEAAEAVGCDVEQIVKSLIFEVDGEIVLALTSGKNTIDTDKLAEAAGGAACGRANPDQVRATTGYAIGGVPPIGHDQTVRSWFDPHLLTLPSVWAAAGTPRHVFEIEPSELVRISGASVVDFTNH